MKSVPLHIEITEDHPAYQWAKEQSDSVNAFGHIGTHLDCYTTKPRKDSYDVEAVVFDCTKTMPLAADFEMVDVCEKAVVLYTGTLESVGYGSEAYGKRKTFLTEEALDALLKRKPAFIVIDACGIGSHGNEHQKFDKRCEGHNCFVVENVMLSKDVIKRLSRLHLIVDLDTSSTGKPCQLWAQC